VRSNYRFVSIRKKINFQTGWGYFFGTKFIAPYRKLNQNEKNRNLFTSLVKGNYPFFNFRLFQVRAVSKNFQHSAAVSLPPQVQAQNRRLAAVSGMPQAVLLRLRSQASHEIPQRGAELCVRPVREGVPAGAPAGQSSPEHALQPRGEGEGPPLCLHLLRQGFLQQERAAGARVPAQREEEFWLRRVRHDVQTVFRATGPSQPTSQVRT
jgi:hypothetical protein